MAVSMAAAGLMNSTAAEPAPKNPDVLIAFYSYSGNTRAAAEQIQRKIGGKLLEIKPKKPYPVKYTDCVAQAKKEINAGFTPPLTEEIRLDSYKVIFLGSPNWWGTMAPPVLSFIKNSNFSGKTIVPFFTHGGGGMQKCESDMRKYCEGVKAEKILPGATYMGSSTRSPLPKLEKWAEESLKTARMK